MQASIISISPAFVPFLAYFLQIPTSFAMASPTAQINNTQIQLANMILNPQFQAPDPVGKVLSCRMESLNESHASTDTLPPLEEGRHNSGRNTPEPSMKNTMPFARKLPNFTVADSWKRIYE